MQSCWCPGFSTEARRMRNQPSGRSYPGTLKTTLRDNSVASADQRMAGTVCLPKMKATGRRFSAANPLEDWPFLTRQPSPLLVVVLLLNVTQRPAAGVGLVATSSCRHSLRERKVRLPVLGPPWQMTEWDFGKTQAVYTQ